MSLIERVARSLYVSLGFEADDPWDQCVERRRNTGMTEPCLSNNQLQCMEAAKAAIAAMPQLEAMQAALQKIADGDVDWHHKPADEMREIAESALRASLDRQGK